MRIHIKEITHFLTKNRSMTYWRNRIDAKYIDTKYTKKILERNFCIKNLQN